MKNHFGKGLMAGLHSVGPCQFPALGKFCDDYKRGFVLGYCHQLEEQTGERRLAAWEAGRLTRRYNLDPERMAEFFTGFRSDNAVRYFNTGYSEG